MENLLFDLLVNAHREQKTWFEIFISADKSLKINPNNEGMKSWKEDSVKHLNKLNNEIDELHESIRIGIVITSF